MFGGSPEWATTTSFSALCTFSKYPVQRGTRYFSDKKYIEKHFTLNFILASQYLYRSICLGDCMQTFEYLKSAKFISELNNKNN